MQQSYCFYLCHLPLGKCDGNFNFNAISVYKVYIDFYIKILGKLFSSDKQMLTKCFKSFLTLKGVVVTKAHTYLTCLLKAADLFKYL